MYGWKWPCMEGLSSLDQLVKGMHDSYDEATLIRIFSIWLIIVNFIKYASLSRYHYSVTLIPTSTLSLLRYFWLTYFIFFSTNYVNLLTHFFSFLFLLYHLLDPKHPSVPFTQSFDHATSRQYLRTLAPLQNFLCLFHGALTYFHSFINNIECLWIDSSYTPLVSLFQKPYLGFFFVDLKLNDLVFVVYLFLLDP